MTTGDGLRQRPEDQSLSQPNDSTDIQTLLVRCIEARRELGKRYGTTLQEAMDLVVYLTGLYVEQKGEESLLETFHAEGAHLQDVRAEAYREAAEIACRDRRHAIDDRDRAIKLAETILGKFTEAGHPGRPSLRTPWVTVEQYRIWNDQLDDLKAAANDETTSGESRG